MAILGQSNPNSYRTNNIFTATAGQTTFSCFYNPTCLDVYQNGVKLVLGSDYSATDGANIILSQGCIAGDTVEIICYKVNLHHAEFTNAAIIISSNTQLQPTQQYIYTASCIMTLPANPYPGYAIRIYNCSGTSTAIVARNGNLIQGIADDLLIDIEDTTLTITYLNATEGWWVS